MKTPDEIKKGLELCIAEVYDCCRCSYHEVGNGDCVTDLKCDALAYIQQLEAERDRLIDTIRVYGGCEFCLHSDCDMSKEPCLYCLDNERWEWGGVQKEE